MEEPPEPLHPHHGQTSTTTTSCTLACFDALVLSLAFDRGSEPKVLKNDLFD